MSPQKNYLTSQKTCPLSINLQHCSVKDATIGGYYRVKVAPIGGYYRVKVATTGGWYRVKVATVGGYHRVKAATTGGYYRVQVATIGGYWRMYIGLITKSYQISYCLRVIRETNADLPRGIFRGIVEGKTPSFGLT